MMPETRTPRLVQKWSARVLAATFPTSVLVLTGWAFRVWDTRPHLTVMVFCLLLGAAMVAAVSWVLAGCHLAVAQAFKAGVTTGYAVGTQQPAGGSRRRPQGLRAVD